MLSGKTQIIAHIGYPTTTFKAPMIYNPWFAHHGHDAFVVPMGVPAEDFTTGFPAIMRFTNCIGALITMPHKISVVAMLDDVSPAVAIAGSCNAVRKDGARLVGDMFDGEGFVRGVLRKGQAVSGARVIVVGAGGVGSAIAASFAAHGAAEIALYDVNAATADGLAQRLARHYPKLRTRTGSNDADGFDIVVNATPLGMNSGDPMPLDISRIAASAFVGEVVLKAEKTAFLEAVEARGCRTQVGVDMLFEQIPAYLEFFGYGTTTPEELRRLAQIEY